LKASDSGEDLFVSLVELRQEEAFWDGGAH